MLQEGDIIIFFFVYALSLDCHLSVCEVFMQILPGVFFITGTIVLLTVKVTNKHNKKGGYIESTPVFSSDFD